MLRNVIVHIANEQPFMADLVNDPQPSDVSLICRNMRTMNGKKPVYVDFADSTFVLPVSQVRFIEIPATSYAEAERAAEVRPLPTPLAMNPTPASEPAQVHVKRPKATAGAAHHEGQLTLPPELEPEPEARGEGRAHDEADAALDADGDSPAEDGSDAIVLFGSAYHDAELDADLLRRIREA